jgi:hypothetical protein
MRITRTFITSALAAVAAAVAIVVAPIAAAAPAQPTPSDQAQTQQSCSSLGGTGSACVAPGNAQVYDAPPPVDYFPYAGGAT